MNRIFNARRLYTIGLLVVLTMLTACMSMNAAVDHEAEMGAMDHGEMDGKMLTSDATVIHGALHIAGIWGRPSFVGGTSAAYFKINNTGEAAAELVGLSADIAEAVELHEVQMKDNVMNMRPVAGGLPIPAGAEVVLAPGGYHVMLINLNQDLAVGETYSLTLQFATGGETAVNVEILEP